MDKSCFDDQRLKSVIERNWAKALIYFALSINPVPKAFGTGQLIRG
jgi:hypothetical protein